MVDRASMVARNGSNHAGLIGCLGSLAQTLDGGLTECLIDRGTDTKRSTRMSRNFANHRLDAAQVMPDSFLKEFGEKDASTRRFLLNVLTLFAAISPEQQHQAINDLIQFEIVILSERSRDFLRRRVQSILDRFHLTKDLSENDIREYYYRYYILTGTIPERLTPDYLNFLMKFIVGVELILMMFSMSFMEQQRLFELQGKYSTQALLFYRYIRPIREKLAREKIVTRDPSGHHYYRRPKLDHSEMMDFVFEVFDLDRIAYLGEYAEKLSFEKDYIQGQPEEIEGESV